MLDWKKPILVGDFRRYILSSRRNQRPIAIRDMIEDPENGVTEFDPKELRKLIDKGLTCIESYRRLLNSRKEEIVEDVLHEVMHFHGLNRQSVRFKSIGKGRPRSWGMDIFIAGIDKTFKKQNIKLRNNHRSEDVFRNCDYALLLDKDIDNQLLLVATRVLMAVGYRSKPGVRLLRESKQVRWN